jgi:hypothetical protein
MGMVYMNYLKNAARYYSGAGENSRMSIPLHDLPNVPAVAHVHADKNLRMEVQEPFHPYSIKPEGTG